VNLIVTNGVLYGSKEQRHAELGIVNGRIAEIGELCARYPKAKVIDVKGRAVLPGLIDMHVHADDRIGDFNLADDWVSVSSAAIKTGVTSLLGFCTQQPGESLKESLRRSFSRAQGRSYCDFGFHCTPTDYDDELWKDVADLHRNGLHTLKLYTTYKQAGLYSDYLRMEQVFVRAKALGLTVLVHCEDEGVLEHAASETPARGGAELHTRCRPEAAEVKAVKQVVALAVKTGVRVHVVHVSSADSLEVIRNGDKEGFISCETAPQYLLLNETRLSGSGGHRYLCTPPLRSEATRKRLLNCAKLGQIDCFATDHCAFTKQDKDRFSDEFSNVPNGLAGVGALAPLITELLLKDGSEGWSEIALRLSENPARICGVYPRKGCLAPGSDADLVVLDMDGPERKVVSSESESFEPYSEFRSRLNVKLALLRGRDVVRDNHLVRPSVPTGGSLWER